jgi:hypothetical protein
MVISLFCAKNMNFGRTAFAVSVLTFYGRLLYEQIIQSVFSGNICSLCGVGTKDQLDSGQYNDNEQK